MLMKCGSYNNTYMTKRPVINAYRQLPGLARNPTHNPIFRTFHTYLNIAKARRVLNPIERDQEISESLKIQGL